MALELYRRKQQEIQDAKDLDQDAKSLLKTQTKILSASVTVNGVMSDLTFNNLTIGKTYRVGGVFKIATATSFNGEVTVKNGATTLGALQSEQAASSDSPNILFEATATTLTFERAMGGGNIFGNNTKAGTYVTLEELPNHEETTQWT